MISPPAIAGIVGAYIGHFVDLPDDQFLAFGDDFQAALDGIDKIGPPDESSVRPVQHRLMMRVKLTRADDLIFFKTNEEPIVEVNEDLIHLRERPGTGPTGDTMRSYGPTCKKCGARHFKDQDCVAFMEFSDKLQVGLFLSTKTPGNGVIEVYENGAETPNRFPDMVHVADMSDDLDAFGLLPFLHEDGRYLQDGHGNADLDVSGEILLELCDTAEVEIPVDPEVEDELAEE